MTGEVQAGNKVRSMHPQKFAMWLFLVSVIMIFISLSSAYIVKKSIGDWVYIEFPSLFQFTTGVIILSSITMHYAYISAKKNNIKQIRLGFGYNRDFGCCLHCRAINGMGTACRWRIPLCWQSS